ncbi:DUF456 domain-containing protein [Streptomyces sp. RB6PN25]|uniref:DUF456 domain-containing protein n=1 Tax=Streptomyces humicola TaxID=2953240 RepID=A0ABT1PZL2_9ACTN|nr:DUF456 domain-containing protein [Streptomyces humicola]MCQ4083115.1 DUF456 domain-containing protein [Streptomyces humicola]
MTAAQLLIVGLVMAAGLLGVLMPGLPGPLVCWAAVLWWASTLHTAFAWYVLFATAAVLVLAQVVVVLMPARRLRDSGISRRTLFLGGISGILGFFVVPVLGGLLGFVGGIYMQERSRLGTHRAARMSTRVAMRAIGASLLVELFACLLVAGTWLGVTAFG